jgi:hypothetical protein
LVAAHCWTITDTPGAAVDVFTSFLDLSDTPGTVLHRLMTFLQPPDVADTPLAAPFDLLSGVILGSGSLLIHPVRPFMFSRGFWHCPIRLVWCYIVLRRFYHFPIQPIRTLPGNTPLAGHTRPPQWPLPLTMPHFEPLVDAFHGIELFLQPPDTPNPKSPAATSTLQGRNPAASCPLTLCRSMLSPWSDLPDKHFHISRCFQWCPIHFPIVPIRATLPLCRFRYTAIVQHDPPSYLDRVPLYPRYHFRALSMSLHRCWTLPITPVAFLANRWIRSTLPMRHHIVSGHVRSFPILSRPFSWSYVLASGEH